MSKPVCAFSSSEKSFGVWLPSPAFLRLYLDALSRLTGRLNSSRKVTCALSAGKPHLSLRRRTASVVEYGALSQAAGLPLPYQDLPSEPCTILIE